MFENFSANVVNFSLIKSSSDGFSWGIKCVEATQKIKVSDENKNSEFFARESQIFPPFFITDLLNIPRHIFGSFPLSRQQSHYLQQHMFQESPATK